MNIVAIIQARMGSTRLPQKVLRAIGGKPMLQWVVERAKRSRMVNDVIVATSDKKQDDLIEKLCKKLKIGYFRGSENDVLNRFYQAAKKYKADKVVRITGDCPFIEPEIIDEVIRTHLKNKNDYTSNDAGVGYPRGLDVEVFNFGSLEKANFKAKKIYEREHVTPYFYENPRIFKVQILKAKGILKRPKFRLCVDKKEDLKLVREIYKILSKRKKGISIFDIIHLLDSDKKLARVNENIRQKKLGE
ncbi:MAG: glycosyltransferase family protein [Candidatus Pacebacteria bacterium]|nr:glycosyltransferase family protein [Candidatus Paceibacterota bacterium]